MLFCFVLFVFFGEGGGEVVVLMEVLAQGRRCECLNKFQTSTNFKHLQIIRMRGVWL